MTYAHSGHAGACTAEPYNGILLEEHKVISLAFTQENDLFLEEKTKPATVRKTSYLWQRQYNCKVHHGFVDGARPHNNAFNIVRRLRTTPKHTPEGARPCAYQPQILRLETNSRGDDSWQCILNID
jgi:hypothetical protein